MAGGAMRILFDFLMIAVLMAAAVILTIMVYW
jgi:hypothetical protein